MNDMKIKFQKLLHNPLSLIAALYFIFRLPNLTLLPIFNDEAIYLDWGWRAVHTPGYLYYSLYDAKQPLIIWLFGISQSLWKDPLFAGRIVSIVLGLITMLGLYFLGRRLFNSRVALLSAITYIVIPIFTLFDRQALLESAMSTISVWAFYFFISFFKYRQTKQLVITGIILGLGFFSKTTALLFFITSVFLLILGSRKVNHGSSIKNISILLTTFLATTALLLINPQFWNTINSNSRYVFTFSELFHFPILSWIQNIYAFFQIGFFFVTPIVFLSAIASFVFIIKNKTNPPLTFWITIPILLAVMTVKEPSQRYFVCLFPFFTILSSYFLLEIGKLLNNYRVPIAYALLFIPLLFSLTQIYNPPTYFHLSKLFSRFSEQNYIYGQTSGYGIPETLDFIYSEANKRKIIVGYAENTGNPESSILVYLNKEKTVRSAYLERKYFGDALNGHDCIKLKSNEEILFVSREEQQAGLENFLTKIKTIYKPSNTGTIGIYKMKEKCTNPLITKMDFIF